MTVIGFTGTRHGPTPIQAGVLGLELARSYRPRLELAHGLCVGADELAHHLATRLGYTTHGFPPIIATYRARVVCDHMDPPASYRARDAAIVDTSVRLLATPGDTEERSPRSGTWLTIRLARRKRIPIRIIWPDGSVTDEP